MSNGKEPTNLAGRALPFFALAVLLFSCAQKPYLSVRYQMPTTVPTQSGKTIGLKVIDQRQQKWVLTEEARKKAELKREAFRLSLTSPGEPESSLGTLDIPALFREAMVHRAEQLGYAVQQEPVKETPALTIALKTFRVDFAQKKWIVEIDYTLSMKGSANQLTSQSVRADGDRRRILATRELEALIDEVFTDAINRADIADLMERTGMK